MESIVYPIHYIKKAPLFKETLKITMEKELKIEDIEKEELFLIL